MASWLNLGQHCIRWWVIAWLHLAIIWSSVDLTSERSPVLYLSLYPIITTMPSTIRNAFRINVYIMKFSGPWPLAYVHALVLVKWVNIGSDTYLTTSRYLENWFAANLRFTTYLNKILLKMKHFSFTKMHVKILCTRCSQSELRFVLSPLLLHLRLLIVPVGYSTFHIDLAN